MIRESSTYRARLGEERQETTHPKVVTLASSPVSMFDPKSATMQSVWRLVLVFRIVV